MKDEGLMIKILVIGDGKWMEKSLNRNITNGKMFQMQCLTDVETSIKRLEHNSYDVLILQDGFLGDNAIRFASMAYAMAKPTVVVCGSLLKYLKYRFNWHLCSKFIRVYKLSKIFIKFEYKRLDDLNLLGQLSQYHAEYVDDVTTQIKNVTKI